MSGVSGSSPSREEAIIHQKDVENAAKLYFNTVLKNLNFTVAKMELGINSGYIEVGKDNEPHLKNNNQGAITEWKNELVKLSKELESNFPEIAVVANNLIEKKDNFKQQLDALSGMLESKTGKLDAKAFNEIGWNEWKEAIKERQPGPAESGSMTSLKISSETKEIQKAAKSLYNDIQMYKYNYKYENPPAVFLFETAKQINQEATELLGIIQKNSSDSNPVIGKLKNCAEIIREKYSSYVNSDDFQKYLDGDNFTDPDFIPSQKLITSFDKFLKEVESAASDLPIYGTLVTDDMMLNPESTTFLKRRLEPEIAIIEKTYKEFTRPAVLTLAYPGTSIPKAADKILEYLNNFHSTDSETMSQVESMKTDINEIRNYNQLHPNSGPLLYDTIVSKLDSIQNTLKKF